MKPTDAERKLPSIWPLAVILIVYLTLGSLFAVLIPPWQVPDEPAHYNYVRQLAQTGAYPIIAVGDYNQDLIGNQIAPPNAKPTFSLDAVQYEDHQPPLFYTLAAPVFLLFNGALIPLRLFSLFVGGFVVLFAYLALREIFPTHPQIAAFAAGFVALLPQHLHMMAGLNNDSLSEALIALSVWLSVHYIVRGSEGAGEQGRGGERAIRNPVSALSTAPRNRVSSPPLPLSPSAVLRAAPLLPLAVVVGLGAVTKPQA